MRSYMAKRVFVVVYVQMCGVVCAIDIRCRSKQTLLSPGPKKNDWGKIRTASFKLCGGLRTSGAHEVR
jgi:hypothetical protein